MTIVILPACGVHMPGSKILLRGDTVMYACWCQISSHFWQIPIHVWCMQWNLQLVQLLQPECTLLVKSVTVSESCHLQTLDYFLQYHIIGLQILVLVLWTLKLHNARAELYSWWCSIFKVISRSRVKSCSIGQINMSSQKLFSWLFWFRLLHDTCQLHMHSRGAITAWLQLQHDHVL